MIPVTAEDANRQKRRIWLSISAAVILVLALGAVLYKRWTDPVHARESYDSGVRLLKIARYDQAILAFNHAVSLEPGMTDAYLMRARAYLGLAKTENAVDDFTHVLGLRPSDQGAIVERGLAYLELKDYPSALADASAAVVLDARSAAAYNLRGLVVRAMGDPRKALDDFTRAVELDQNADNYYQRGATYQKMGEHEKAIADFNQVIAFKPDESPAYFARAESRRALGDLAGAKRDHDYARIIDGR